MTDKIENICEKIKTWKNITDFKLEGDDKENITMLLNSFRRSYYPVLYDQVQEIKQFINEDNPLDERNFGTLIYLNERLERIRKRTTEETTEETTE